MSLQNELGFINPIETRAHEALMNVVLTSALLVKQGHRLMRPFGLTDAQFNVLMLLKYQSDNGELNQTDLGNMLVVNRSNVTGLVDRLEQADPNLPESAAAVCCGLIDPGSDFFSGQPFAFLLFMVDQVNDLGDFFFDELFLLGQESRAQFFRSDLCPVLCSCRRPAESPQHAALVMGHRIGLCRFP